MEGNPSVGETLPVPQPRLMLPREPPRDKCRFASVWVATDICPDVLQQQQKQHHTQALAW